MTMFDLPDAQFIRVDIFPAIVRSAALPDGVKDGCRLIVTDAHVHIIADTSNGPAVYFSDLLSDIQGRMVTGYKITTEDGDELEARRGGGCGCGSKLRGLRVFPGVPFATLRQGVM